MNPHVCAVIRPVPSSITLSAAIAVTNIGPEIAESNHLSIASTIDSERAVGIVIVVIVIATIAARKAAITDRHCHHLTL